MVLYHGLLKKIIGDSTYNWAEYIAAAFCACWFIWLKMILEEIGIVVDDATVISSVVH